MRKLKVSQYLLIRIILPVLLLISIPLLILLSYINKQFINERIAVMTQNLAVIEHGIDEHIDHMQENYLMAKKVHDTVTNNDVKRMLLSNFVATDSSINSFFEMDRNGRILRTYPNQPLLNGTIHPAWKTRRTLQDRVTISNPFKDDINGAFVLYLMPQVAQDTNLVMAFSVDLNRYLEHLKEREIRLFIYNGNQLLLKSSEDMTNQGIGPIIDEYQYRFDSYTVNLKETVYLGKGAVFEELIMEINRWTLIALTDKDNIFGSQRLILIVGMLIIIVLGGVYSIFTIGLNRQLVKPLKILSDYFLHYEINADTYKIEMEATETSLTEFEALYAGIKALNLEIINTYHDLYEFSTIAAHDLREPLRTIISYLEILKNEYFNDIPEDGMRYIEHIFNATKRSQNLIDALLTYATLKRSLVLETFEMGLCVNQVLENLQSSIVEKEAQIMIGPLPKIVADKSFFERLMQNLISNSLKYGHQKVAIEISMTEQDLIIKDTGIGFDPQYSELIFMPFKRLHTSDAYSGTGIGLAMVARIADRQKWDLSVASEIGKGTTFTIRLAGSMIKD